MNRIIALLLFIILSPILFLISVIIFIDDGFPIFFKQKRIGIENNSFTLFKFRTMKRESPNISTEKIKNISSYYTRSGIFLRKFSFDELPQFINIFFGHMNFIGPRPALYNQYKLISLRSKVGVEKILPGITGWAQVNGRDTLNSEEKVKLDKYYLKNKSLYLNIKIIILTFLRIFLTDGVYIEE